MISQRIRDGNRSLALPSGTEIQALFPGHPHLAPGDETAIRFDPPKLVLFRME